MTYIYPAPGLEQQLAAAQAEALAAHELAHTVQQRADGANARANNLSDELNASNAIVQHMQTDFDLMKSNPPGSSGTATVLGVLGMVFGLAGVGLALMRGRGAGGCGGGGGGLTRTESQPAETKPHSQGATSGPEASPPSPPPSG